jgi:predicted nucleotidyltransferase
MGVSASAIDGGQKRGISYGTMNQVLTLSETKTRVLSVMEGCSEACLCYIYGSVANGFATNSSDVDIAVACHGPMMSRDRQSLQEKLTVALNRDVTCSTFRTQQGRS